jgi:hypothetical protein
MTDDFDRLNNKVLQVDISYCVKVEVIKGLIEKNVVSG